MFAGMKQIFVIASFALLTACSNGFQKLLSSDVGVSEFRSAMHIAGETPTSRTVVYLVASGPNGEMGLMTHVARLDGGVPGVSRATTGSTDLDYLRLAGQQTPGLVSQSGLITLTGDQIARAARTGMDLRLCGANRCYQADVPAGLFQQALVE